MSGLQQPGQSWRQSTSGLIVMCPPESSGRALAEDLLAARREPPVTPQHVQMLRNAWIHLVAHEKRTKTSLCLALPLVGAYR